jgi:hypothetical protein
MISRYVRQLRTENPAPKGLSKLMGSEAEARSIEFCLRCQFERNPVTANDAIEFMREAGKHADRSWVYRCFDCSKGKLAVYEAVLMEKEQREVSADDLERYFETVDVHLKDFPSLPVRNPDETRIGSRKKQRPPQVIATKDTLPERSVWLLCAMIFK